jgi:hypothetical protein
LFSAQKKLYLSAENTLHVLFEKTPVVIVMDKQADRQNIFELVPFWN